MTIPAQLPAVGIIPARLPSSRLPEKPLKDIAGKTLVQRVYEQASKASSLQEVYIATDDERIVEHARSFGAEAIMTSAEHPSGTDRVYEALQILESRGAAPFDIAVNVQGDMPFISPRIIDNVVGALRRYLTDRSGVSAVSTLAFPITDTESFQRPDTAKVVMNTAGEALYFSRASIPFRRDGLPTDGSLLGYQHVGLYAYHRDALRKFTELSPTTLEELEMLEQLRGLSNSIPYLVHAEEEPDIGSTLEVNTPEDLEVCTQYALEKGI
jgi:3-deoxy-manno-octulosonate cytidylyltransferase (CMP-KDO synthetase)